MASSIRQCGIRSGRFCRHFHTIRYDRRGYGRSPAAKGWYSETDDLRALLHHLKVPKTAIVGSSHGGELSIDFTLAYPDVVQRLVLVGAVVSGMPSPSISSTEAVTSTTS